MNQKEVLGLFEKFCGYLTAVSVGANIPNSLSGPLFVAAGFKNLTEVSVGANIPNSLSALKFVALGFKNMEAISMESGYSFKAKEDTQNAAKNAVVGEAIVETKIIEEDEEEFILCFFD